MTCKGVYYGNAANNNNVAGPELIIKFSNPDSEAHIHFRPEVINNEGTTPSTVCYPHWRGKLPTGLINYGQVTTSFHSDWEILVRKCKKSVDASSSSEWKVASASKKPFFKSGGGISISNVLFKGYIPGTNL